MVITLEPGLGSSEAGALIREFDFMPPLVASPIVPLPGSRNET